MCRSSRIVPGLIGAVLLVTATPPGRAAPGDAPAIGGRLVLAQADGFPGAGPAGVRPFGFPVPPPPFAPPLAPAGGIAAPPRCPLVIQVGRGLAHAVRTRVIHGRPACG